MARRLRRERKRRGGGGNTYTTALLALLALVIVIGVFLLVLPAGADVRLGSPAGEFILPSNQLDAMQAEDLSALAASRISMLPDGRCFVVIHSTYPGQETAYRINGAWQNNDITVFQGETGVMIGGCSSACTIQVAFSSTGDDARKQLFKIC